MLSLPAVIRLSANNYGSGYSFGPFSFSAPPEVGVEIEFSTPFCSKHLMGPGYSGGDADSIYCGCKSEAVPCERLSHPHHCKCGEGHKCAEDDYTCLPHLPDKDDHPLEQLAKINGHDSNLRARLTALEEENATLRERLDRLEALLTKEVA